MSNRGEPNLGAARAVMRAFGGLEPMIEQGTHISDLVDRVVYPGKDIDPASIRQLDEFAELLGIRRDGTSVHDGDELYPLRHDVSSGLVDLRPSNTEDEPLIHPFVARHWLVEQTRRATETEDGEIVMESNPDHLGLAALKLATGEELGLFTEAYAEVTENESPIAEDTIKDFARNMVSRYAEENE